MTEYQQLLQAIEQYYGSGSDQWAEIAKYGIASKNAEQILKQVPGVNIVKNANGTIRSYNLNASENIVSNVEQAVNSNVPAVIKSFEVPANTGVETITSGTGEAVKQMTFKSGMKQAGNFVFGEVAPRVAAVATGITLGKTIDKSLYSVNPDFWDEHGMSNLNPDKWGDIIGTDTAGHRLLNVVLGTSPSGQTQAYMDENALAYMTYYYKTLGVLDPNTEYSKETIQNNITIPAGASVISGIFNGEVYNGLSQGQQIGVSTLDNTPSYLYGTTGVSTKFSVYNQIGVVTTDEKSFTVSNYSYPKHYNGIGFSDYGDYTYNNKTVYYAAIPKNVVDWLKNGQVIYKGIIPDSDITGSNDWYTLLHNVAWYTQFGEKNTKSAVDGITDQTDAKIFDPSTVDDIASALQALKEQYPYLWNNAVTQDVVQPDGSTVTYTYVPVAMPELDSDGNPVSSSSNQANPQVNPATATESLLKTVTDLLRTFPPINPPDTGDGDTPVAPPVTGSASSLYAIYNPTLAEINSFGAWLWSDNFIDQIKKLFNDPMQAIIGLHKIYAQPITGGAQNIKVGYLDSGVASAIVANQYTTIDCGTVRLSEQFHNVFDYSPFTEVNLYLPFIGIVRLDVSDVMRASIHIVYHVDVLSGACLADVKVVRDSSGGTLYQYAGNASVTLPISSGSYMGIVASVASIAGGIAGTIASGGSALPLIASSASSMFNAHTRVEHSGGFSGNAGAMGGKIPYLIISRPQTAMANEFNKYIGYPSNFTATLGSCKGFVKVIECHLENINATKSELEEIDSILKEGVII